MAVYDVNNISHNVPNLPKISEEARNVFQIRINSGGSGTALANNDWLDLLNIPPYLEITRFSVRSPKAKKAGAYKLIIADGPALSTKAADGSTNRAADKTLVSWAADALAKDKWLHYSINDSSAGANVVLGGQDWWTGATDYRALSLQVTTVAATDANDPLDFDISWWDRRANYRGD